MRVRGTKLEPQGHAGSFRPYIWRDPARCSADRLAELAAHDDYIAVINELWARPYQQERLRRRLAA